MQEEMRIYLKSGAATHLILVTPGADANAPDFKDPDGSNKLFKVRFADGMAIVPPVLGQYLIKKGLCQKKRPAIRQAPRGVLAAAVARVRNHRVLASSR